MVGVVVVVVVAMTVVGFPDIGTGLMGGAIQIGRDLAWTILRGEAAFGVFAEPVAQRYTRGWDKVVKERIAGLID